MNTGAIVDFYDDPSGSVLKTKLAHEQIPDYVRKASYQSPEKLAALPDDAFALVMVDNGEKLRKFACVDKGNVALNVIYFMENRDKLPEEAQKVAAANLLAYCDAYEIAAPWELQKIAGVSLTRQQLEKAAGVSSIWRDQKGEAIADAFEEFERKNPGVDPTDEDIDRIFAAGKKKYYNETTAGKYSVPLSAGAGALGGGLLGAALGARKGRMELSVPASVVSEVSKGVANGPELKSALKGGKIRFNSFANKMGKGALIGSALGGVLGAGAELLHRKGVEKTSGLKGINVSNMVKKSPIKARLPKMADVTGSEIMPLQSARAKENLEGDDPISTQKISCGVDDGEDAKIKSASPYVDITGKRAPIKFEKKASSMYCLVKEGQGRFPIDSYGQVLEANKWFEENGKSLHPSDRKEFCEKLAARADELHISVTDNIRKYAGKGYADPAEIRLSVATRQQFWADGSRERSILDGLMDKYASVRPEVFCEALRQFDEQNGLDQMWDSQVADPWYSTYGAEKVAAWSWTQGADTLTEEQLVNGVHESDKIYQIKQRFGEDMAKELAAKPIEVFDSLPLDTKRIISRLLSDAQ